MAEDTTTKKVLIDIQLKSDQLKSDVVSLNTTLDTLLVKQLQLKAAGKQNTEQFVGLSSEIRNTKTAIREANKDIDNSSKALNSQAGSANQTKAVISLLSREYDKLTVSEGKTAASTVALGNKLATLRDGLNKQRQAVNDNTSNIGNYTASILRAIPGLSQYSNIITQASSAFNVMGNSAKTAAAGETELGAAAVESEVGVAGLSGAAAIAAGVFAVVAAAIAGVIVYLKNLDGVTDKVEQGWAGLKAAFFAVGSSIQEGKWSDLQSNMIASAAAAAELKDEMQNLGDAMLIQSVKQQKADEEISVLQLKLRDKRNTPAQEKEYFNQIQQISESNYKVQKALADKQYQLAIDNALVGRYLTTEEIKNLRERGVAYAIELENENKILASQTKGIADAQKAQIAADRAKEVIQQRAQNRDDAYNAKQDAAAEKQKQMQQEIIRGTKEQESQRISSYQRTLEFQQEAFGKELSQTAEHYRQLIFKEQEFIDKQEAIANNPKNSGKTRSLAGNAVSAGKANIAQTKKEQYSALEKLLSDHHKAVIDDTQRAANDLSQLQLQSITDQQDRAINANALDLKEKKEALDKQIQLITENKDKLANQYKTASSDEKAGLKEEYDKEVELLSIALDKKTELQIQYQQKNIDIIKQFSDQKTSIEDQIGVLNAGNKKGLAGGKDNAFNSDLQAAKQKSLLDDYNAEVSQKGLTEEAKLLIEKEYLDKSKVLTEQNEREKRDIIVGAAEQVASAALTIIGNAAKSDQQRKEVELSKGKDRELANTSLTSAQKLAVENKYRILEGQAKVKAFKTDQKLSLAKAAIDTAAAIIKAAPNPILIALAAALGATEIGVIAAQKPPAYAKGGTFKSDGKGSVLPGYSKKDNVNAQLRSGEAVIVSEAVRDPYARSILSGINQAFGGRSFGEVNPGRGYAIGGIVTDGNNSNRYYAQPQEGTENLANTIAYSLINNFPPIITQVRDINNQQGILAKTMNRVDI